MVPLFKKKLWGTWTVVLTIFAIHISSIPVIFFWLWHVLVLYCVFLFFHAIMYVFCACVEIYTSTSRYVYLPFTRPLHTHFWSFYWQHGMNFPFLSDFKCKYSSRRRRIRDTVVWRIFDPSSFAKKFKTRQIIKLQLTKVHHTSLFSTYSSATSTWPCHFAAGKNAQTFSWRHHELCTYV